MEMLAKSHIPVEQYGFIELEYSFVDGNLDDFHKLIIDEYNLIQGRFKLVRKPKSSAPTELGETMVENGHTFKAVMNEKDQKLYWLIDRI